jgi:DNA polymerase III delta prime subunit
MENKKYLWVEQYRPQTINDCILPENLANTFNGIVEAGKMPNLLLAGSAGTGKTTVAKALCNELDCSYLFINGSKDGNIDTLRTTIQDYSSSISLDGKRKVVILDEADYLNPQSTQPALRGFIEEFSSSCAFILTCNFKNKVIEPLHSRCCVVEFRVPKNEKKKITVNYLQRLVHILKKEQVKYDTKVLAKLTAKYFPDFRRIINELQLWYTKAGEINEGVLSAGSDLDINNLFKALKAKNYSDIRGWIVENLDNESARIYKSIFDGLKDNLPAEEIPVAVILLAEYQYKSAFVVDQELNLLACCTELLVNCFNK